MAENDINLAALWIPVMAETSHIKEQLKKAGEEGKKAFLDGLSGAGEKAGEGFLEGLRSSDLTGGMTRILQGGWAGVVAAFTEKGLDLIGETFEKMTEMAKEAAKSIIEVGEAWHEVGRQLETFTNASGEKLEELKRTADDVVRGGLDVSMKDLGQTMGILSQRIGLTGQPLETMTRHVMELGDRFGRLNVQNLAAAFHGFGVSGADADKALQSLLNVARNLGMPLDEVIAGAKQGGSVFRQLGLDIGESGALAAQLSAAGIDLAPVLRALQASMKKLPPGETLAEGIKDLVSQLRAAIDTGNVAAQQDLATKIFGPKWADALQAIQRGLLDTNTLVSTFADNGAESIDQFLEHTKSLGNEWQDFKNQMALDLQPLGETAIKGLEEALSHLKKWIDEHHNEIIEKIREYGSKFIDNLPLIKQFVEGAIVTMGAFFDFMKNGAATIGSVLADITWLWAKVTFNDDLASRADDMLDSFQKMEKLDFTTAATTLSHVVDGIDTSPEKLQELKDALNGITDNLKDPIWSAAGAGTTGPGALGSLGGPMGSVPSIAPLDNGGGADVGASFGAPGGAGRGLIIGPGGPGTTPNGFKLSPSLQRFTVNGQTEADAAGGPASRLAAFAQWFNDNIEPVKQLSGFDAGGHGMGSQSNHASGTALDINWDDFTALQGHGADARTHFSQAQMRTIVAKLNEMGMNWGQYWTPDSRDPGHFELSGAPYSQNGPQNVGPLAGQAAGFPGRGFPLPWKLGGGDENGGASSGGNAGGLGALGQAFTVAPPAAADNTGRTPSPFDNAAPPPPADNSPIPVYPFTPFSPVSVPTVGYNHEGMPMSGAYGGISTESAVRDAEAVQEAQHRLELSKVQVNTLTGQIAAAQKAGEDAQKIHDLEQRRAEAIFNQNKALQDLTDTQTKQVDDWNKIPSEGSRKGKGNGSQFDSIGSQLGGGLLKGLGQEMGFGDLFGKAPWDWGLVKLLGGLASTALNTGNAWADDQLGIGGGASGGVPGGGGGGGGLGGLLGMIPGVKQLSGINPAASTPNVSGGPNIMPTGGSLAESRPSNAPALPPGQVANTFNIQAQNPDQAAQTFNHLTNSNGFQNSMGTAGIGPMAQG